MVFDCLGQLKEAVSVAETRAIDAERRLAASAARDDNDHQRLINEHAAQIAKLAAEVFFSSSIRPIIWLIARIMQLVSQH